MLYGPKTLTICLIICLLFLPLNVPQINLCMNARLDHRSTGHIIAYSIWQWLAKMLKTSQKSVYFKGNSFWGRAFGCPNGTCLKRGGY